ncbi:MAG: protein kinase domain-containing protein [Acidobacteriota bacterium]
MSSERGSDPTEVETKREGFASERARPTKPEQLARGTLVGRYVVIDKLGEGGMGIVYAAFDPELDRKVAIKVLQGDASGSESGGQAWLLREAQALARLAHPNVVAVHDVGSLPNNQVFVAMELVDGITVRAWLKQRARSWREVLPVMRAAGAGLAAAHRAGLVHRDFKPENVLVGNDGRVRVMDFGLARLGGGDVPASRDSDLSIETKSPLSADLTLAGHVVGTPAYMAPEIYDEQPADARSDQFAFGVTLFEALYGRRPFSRDDLHASRSAPPKPRIPTEAKVPAPLAKVALQAIAVDPAQRFASMDELLAALAADPYARRRAALGFAAGTLLVAGAVVATMKLARGPAPCEGIEHRLDGVWDAKAKAAVRDAYLATKLPFAPQAFADLERTLDKYTGEWVATAVESCKATRVRRDQSEEVLSLRQTCLDQRLAEIAAFAKVATDPGRSLVERGGSPIRELPPIARCSNVAALRDQGTMPPEDLWPQVKEINKNLADAQAQIVAGNYVAAGAATLRASRLAEQMGFLPTKAEADVMHGLTLAAVQSYDEAIKALTDGTLAAMIGKRDDIAAHGAFTVALMLAEGPQKIAEARMWITVGKAEARRNGVDVQLAQREAQVEGIVEGVAGNIPAALAAHERSFAFAKQDLGADNPLLWEDEELYGATLERALRFEDAARHFEHAIALREKVVGRDHPDQALLMSNLGACYSRRRDPRARPMLEHALAIREKTFGKNNPVVVPTVQNLGESLRFAGELPEALALNERATRIAANLPGKDHPMYHSAATDYAQTLAALGRVVEARAAIDEALALETKTSSPVLPETLAARADIELADHQWAAAASFAARSIAAYEAAGGSDNPALWWPQSVLGRADVELGKLDEARAMLDRALATGDRVHLVEVELAPARAARAKL